MVVDSSGYLVKAGDILSFRRAGYSHVALAVDGDSAVHLTADDIDFDIDGLLGSCAGKTYAWVRRDKIQKIAKTSEFFVTNAAWQGSTRSRKDVVREALNCVGECMKYNLLTWNCEHFVNALVTGQASSQQVRDAVTVAAVGATVGVGLIGGIALLLRGLFTSDKEEEEEEQVA